MSDKPVQPSEAGFSTNLYLNNEKSGRVQFTFRGATVADWKEVMTTVHDFLTDMHSKGWMMDGEWRDAEAEKMKGKVADLEANHPEWTGKGKPVTVKDLPPDLPTAAEGGASEYFKDEFDSFQIIPEPDEKATVKFLKTGMKYPVGAPINKWKNKQVAEILNPLGEFDVTKPQVVNVRGVQYWVNGNAYTNQKGEQKHYKDLKRVERL